jgi:hypothetical protein
VLRAPCRLSGALSDANSVCDESPHRLIPLSTSRPQRAVHDPIESIREDAGRTARAPLDGTAAQDGPGEVHAPRRDHWTERDAMTQIGRGKRGVSLAAAMRGYSREQQLALLCGRTPTLLSLSRLTKVRWMNVCISSRSPSSRRIRMPRHARRWNADEERAGGAEIRRRRSRDRYRGE